MNNQRLKYHNLLVDFKEHLVSKKDCEFACFVRDVELKHFLPDKWQRPRTTSQIRNSKINILLDYPDFNSNEFIRDFENCVRKYGSKSIDAILESKLNKILLG